MKSVRMQRSGLLVSEMCFGTLVLGRIQANLSPTEGARAIQRALELGVRFVDTAATYGTYQHVRLGLDGWHDEVIVASKSKACTYDAMRLAVEEALRKMNLPRIGIFLLHLVRSKEDLLGREDALQCLVDLRKDGVVQAIGVSSHSPQGVRAVLDYDEIDVVFPIVNKDGLGIVQGTHDEMLEVIQACRAQGRDLYAMKPLGGGHLVREIPAAIEYIRGLALFDAIAIGMKTPDEVEMNVRVFEGRPVPPALRERIWSAPKRLVVYDTCERCGTCEDTCDQDAIHVGKEKAIVDEEKCILCGYCAASCPVFCLRVVESVALSGKSCVQSPGASSLSAHGA